MLSQWQEEKDSKILQMIQNNPAEEDYYMKLSDRADRLIEKVREHNLKTNSGGQTR